MIPKKLNDGVIKDILAHAKDAYPNESCGVVVKNGRKQFYHPCENIAKDTLNQFRISPVDYTSAEDLGEVVGIVHSHPDGTSVPSSHDLAVMSINRELELELIPDSKPTPWHIVSWPDGDYRQIIPEVHWSLLNRKFIHGIWDCWSTCQSYYKRYHNINFETFEREDCWWENKEAESLYEKHFKGAGFYEVETAEPGDMIVMQIGRSYHPNHAGIYLGDITEFEDQQLVGGPFMLHHLYGRKSEVVVYGGQWDQRKRLILRHKEISK